MEKFKIGDKVYCILYGPGKVVDKSGEDYLVSVQFKNAKIRYTYDGRYYQEAMNPTLLTLEEARAKGYDVPKIKVKKNITIYINLYENGQYAYSDKLCAELNYKDTTLVVGKGLVKAYPVTVEYEVEE